MHSFHDTSGLHFKQENMKLRLEQCELTYRLECTLYYLGEEADKV